MHKGLRELLGSRTQRDRKVWRVAVEQGSAQKWQGLVAELGEKQGSSLAGVNIWQGEGVGLWGTLWDPLTSRSPTGLRP